MIRRKLLFYFIIIWTCSFYLAAFINAATFTYSYDSVNRLTNATYSDGSREFYSYDPSGNRLERVTLAATSSADVTPPSIPTNLVSTAFSPSQLNITWDRAFDTGGSGLAGYQIYINGSLAGTSSNTNFAYFGLSPNSQYCLTVAAFDHDNNVSAQSSSLCLTTPVFQQPYLISLGVTSGHLLIGVAGGTTGPYNIWGSSNLLDWRWETNVWLPLANDRFLPINFKTDSHYFYRLGWSTNTP